MDRLNDDVLRVAQDKYGKGPQPNYSFVRDSLSAAPFAAPVSELRRTFDVMDDTDSNDDVSFNYILRRGPSTWRLALSMVGPYALLIGASKPNATTVVTEAGGDPDTATIIQFVKVLGLTLLDRDTIRRRPNFGYEGSSDDDWTIYNALFTRSELPPG